VLHRFRWRRWERGVKKRQFEQSRQIIEKLERGDRQWLAQFR